MSDVDDFESDDIEDNSFDSIDEPTSYSLGSQLRSLDVRRQIEERMEQKRLQQDLNYCWD